MSMQPHDNISPPGAHGSARETLYFVNLQPILLFCRLLLSESTLPNGKPRYFGREENPPEERLVGRESTLWATLLQESLPSAQDKNSLSRQPQNHRSATSTTIDTGVPQYTDSNRQVFEGSKKKSVFFSRGKQHAQETLYYSTIYCYFHSFMTTQSRFNFPLYHTSNIA